jgi:hypothetical protein
MFNLKTRYPQEMIDVGLAVVQLPMMRVTAHTQDVKESVALIEIYQMIPGYFQQGYSHVHPSLIEENVADYTDTGIINLLTGVVPGEVRLPILNKSQYLAMLFCVMRSKALEDSLTIQIILEQAGLPLLGGYREEVGYFCTHFPPVFVKPAQMILLVFLGFHTTSYAAPYPA